MNEHFEEVSKLWIVTDRRKVLRGAVVGAIAAPLAIGLEDAEAADRRLMREARQHFEEMIRLARQSRREAERYYRRQSREIRRAIRRGQRVSKIRLRTSRRISRGDSPRPDRVRARATTEQVSTDVCASYTAEAAA